MNRADYENAIQALLKRNLEEACRVNDKGRGKGNPLAVENVQQLLDKSAADLAALAEEWSKRVESMRAVFGRDGETNPIEHHVVKTDLL